MGGVQHRKRGHRHAEAGHVMQLWTVWRPCLTECEVGKRSPHPTHALAQRQACARARGVVCLLRMSLGLGAVRGSHRAPRAITRAQKRTAAHLGRVKSGMTRIRRRGTLERLGLD